MINQKPSKLLFLKKNANHLLETSTQKSQLAQTQCMPQTVSWLLHLLLPESLLPRPPSAQALP